MICSNAVFITTGGESVNLSIIHNTWSLPIHAIVASITSGVFSDNTLIYFIIHHAIQAFVASLVVGSCISPIQSSICFCIHMNLFPASVICSCVLLCILLTKSSHFICIYAIGHIKLLYHCWAPNSSNCFNHSIFEKLFLASHIADQYFHRGKFSISFSIYLFIRSIHICFSHCIQSRLFIINLFSSSRTAFTYCI